MQDSLRWCDGSSACWYLEQQFVRATRKMPLAFLGHDHLERLQAFGWQA